MRTVIKNAISFDDQFQVQPTHLLNRDGVIEQVSRNEIKSDPGDQVFDLQGRLIVPGFVDSHTHLAQSFGRGIYDNLHLTEWLEKRSWDRPLNKKAANARRTGMPTRHWLKLSASSRTGTARWMDASPCASPPWACPPAPKS